MDIQNYLPDAIDVVLAWNLPDEALTEAIRAQASLMARGNPEEIGINFSD